MSISGVLRIFSSSFLYQYSDISVLTCCLSQFTVSWMLNVVSFYCRNLSGLNLDGEISPAIGDLKDLLSMYCTLSLCICSEI